VEITLRTPCTYHKNCDETAVGLLHRSSKEGQPKPDEKLCMVCEGVLEEAGRSLKSTGKWPCPVCGFVHTVDIVNRGPVTPPLSKWYTALQVEKTG
jgi:hypothetical protein